MEFKFLYVFHITKAKISYLYLEISTFTTCEGEKRENYLYLSICYPLYAASQPRCGGAASAADEAEAKC